MNFKQRVVELFPNAVCEKTNYGFLVILNPKFLEHRAENYGYGDTENNAWHDAFLMLKNRGMIYEKPTS